MNYKPIEYFAFFLTIFGGLALLYYLLKNLKVITIGIIKSPFLVLNEIVNILLLPFLLISVLWMLIINKSQIKKNVSSQIKIENYEVKEKRIMNTKDYLNSIIVNSVNETIITESLIKITSNFKSDFKTLKYHIIVEDDEVHINLDNSSQFQYLFLFQLLNEELLETKLIGKSTTKNSKHPNFRIYNFQLEDDPNSFLGQYDDNEFFIVNLYKPETHKLLQVYKIDKLLKDKITT